VRGAWLGVRTSGKSWSDLNFLPFQSSVVKPWPNETVEKVRFSAFLEKILFDNQWLMSSDFQVLGFFDNLNNRLQLTASSVRSYLAPASGSS
jgi:hypothetical protein